MKLKKNNPLMTALRATKSKTRRFGSTQLLVGASLISLVGQASAQTDLFWDNGGVGNGTWDDVTTNWDNLANLAGTDQVWSDGSNANFQTVNGGVVTLANVHTVNNLSASSGGAGPHNWALNNNPFLVQGTAEISAATNNNLTINSSIGGATSGQALAFATGGSGTIAVAGNILGTIGAVTANADLTLSGNNAFTGPLSVGSGTTTLAGGLAVLDTTAVNLTGSSTLTLANNETIGALTGDAGTNIALGTNALTVNQNTDTAYNGAILGTAPGGNPALAKTGTGSLTLGGANTYTGLTNVNAGAIIANTNTALGATGAGNETVVASGATVALQGGFSTAEDFTITGAGAAPFAGAIDSTGNNTITGQITMTGNPATINSASGTLTLTGGVTSTVLFGQDVLTFAGPGNIDLDGPGTIDTSLEAIRKTGTGSLDLSGVDNDYINTVGSGQSTGTSIVDGTVIVDNDNNLGSQSGTALQAVSFDGAAGQSPTLQIINNDVDFGDRDFQVNGPLGNFDVTGANTAFIDNDDLSFASPTNTLAQIGTGTLEIDATDTGVGAVATIDGILDAPAGTLTVLGAGFSGLNPAFGPGGVPLPGATTLNLSGLGNAAGGQTGTINLGIAGNEFDNVLVDQSVDTIFDGALNTTGDLIITGTGTLSLGGPVSVNNIHISGNQMIVTDPTSLGDNINSHDQRATFVWGQFDDAVIPDALNTPGQLSLSGGITTSERITIVNNGILNNLDGDNIVDSEVRVQFNGSMVPAGFSGSDNAQIGATDGSLTLAQGIFSNPGQNVTFNGLATDNGTVNVAGQIQSTVADVVIGNPANTGTVILGAANSYSGTTTVNGSNVVVGNSGSFSAGNVIVNNASTFDSQGGAVAIANDIAINDTLTLGGINSTGLSLNGSITGAGGITNADGTNTLGGNNTYSGATTVASGTLNINGANASTAINVNGGTLATSAGNLLADAATLTVANGATANIGGPETIGSLANSGTVTVGGLLTTTANSIVNNAGATLNSVGINTTSITNAGTINSTGDINTTVLNGAGTGIINFGANTLTAESGNYAGDLNQVAGAGSIVKNGSGTLTLSGNNLGVTGKTTVNDGTLAANNLGSGTVDVNTGGTLTASGTFASTNINVNTGGTLNANSLIANAATVNTSGAVVVNSGPNTIANLNINAASGSVTLAGGDLTTGGLNGGGTINLGANTLSASNGSYNGTINGTGGFTKTGGGVLTLAGTNGYTGATNVDAGTLIGATPLNTSAITVAGGASYQNQGGLLNAAATISNQGTFTLFGNEQGSVYNSNGGLLNGAGTLTAPTYNLSNGASTGVGANLGLGTLNVAGAAAVTLNGTAEAGIVNINSGNLTLGSAGRLVNPDAVVNNFATLTLGGDETITTYNANGGALTNAGTLTAGTYNLSNGATTALGSDLGEGTLNIVDVNPPAGADAAVTLNGLAGADTVNINATTTLNLGSAERLDDTAVVTNSGRLNLNGTETVGTFISSGTLGGAGTLIGTGNTITLLNGHVSLAGTMLQDFGPNPNLTSDGIVNINGANDQTVANNARINVGTAVIQSGTMNLSGLFINNGSLTIDSGAALVSGFSDRIANGATVNNNGTWTLGGNDTIGTYNATGLLNGAGTLTAASYNLSNGASTAVGANLGSGILNSTGGTVTLNGTSAAGNVNVDAGNLILASGTTLTNPNSNVSVDSPATLTLSGNETIGSLVLGDNTGGVATLTETGAGEKTVTADTFTLNDSSVVTTDVNLAGKNALSTLTSNGSVNVQGDSNVATTTIASGALTMGGSLDYNLLQGNGQLNAAGTTFTNDAGSTVNPGVGAGNTGALTINDNFVNNGNLVLDANRQFGAVANCILSPSNHDVLNVNGTTTVGIINVTKQGGEFARGESAVLINSGGNISVAGANFTSNYANRNFLVIDNTTPTNTATLLGTGVAGANGNLNTIAGLTSNQEAIATAVNANIAGNGNILIRSNSFLGSTADDVALAVIGKCNDEGAGANLNMLSPEGYAGMIDYGIQVTKSFTTAAMSMPGTSVDGTGRSVRIPVGMDGEPAPAPIYSKPSTSVFAGYTYFDTGSDSSINGADYDITSHGGIVGVRHNTGAFMIGGFLGIDQGDLDSSFIDADVDGYLLGLMASYVIKPEMNLMVTGGVTYGNYEFDGDRQSLLGQVDFDTDSDVFDIHLGIEGDVYTDDCWRVSPFLQLHYVTAEVDGFNETPPTASSLLVNSLDDDAFFAEIGIKAEYQVNDRFSVNGNLSYTHNFIDSDRDISATLGGTPFSVSAPGLGEDILTVGVGAQYQVTEQFRLGANYRAEFSDDTDTTNAFSIGGSYSF